MKGDCLRQCVARVLGRKPHTVPDFVRLYRGRWSWHLMQWCERIGRHAILAPARGRYWSETHASEGVRRWIQIGVTRRGTHHAVVMEAEKNRPARVTYDGGSPLKRVKGILYILEKGTA